MLIKFKLQCGHATIVQHMYSINYGIGMKRRLDFRVEDYEFGFLETYCKELGRTKTDVLREFLRSLAQKKPS